MSDGPGPYYKPMMPDDEAWRRAEEWYVDNTGGSLEDITGSPSGIFGIAFPENWYSVVGDPQKAYDRISRFCKKYGISPQEEQAALDYAKQNWDDFVKYYQDNDEDPGAGSILRDYAFGPP
jgi:hypothetical protein